MTMTTTKKQKNNSNKTTSKKPKKPYLKNFSKQHDNFTYFLDKNRHQKQLTLFYDIETFQFNEQQAKEQDKPTLYKNYAYSVAVSYINNNIVDYVIYPSFKKLLDTIVKHTKTSQTITLNAHNSNKYDNHFLRYSLLNDYNLPIKNLYIKNANDEANAVAEKLSKLTTTEKQSGVLLEKRIKSKNNLELLFFIENHKFKTVDNWLKTNTSLKQLGKKLEQQSLLDSKYLKQDESFNYTKYNRAEDLHKTELSHYATSIFNNLTTDELTYIRNDVIILAYSVLYYSQLFYNFDYSKLTFTSNILASYNTNKLTEFQLLNQTTTGKTTTRYNQTDYSFDGVNFYDYLKPFYCGGLNFYNETKLNRIINKKHVSMDINSSYPFAMHNYKIPTYIKCYKSYPIPTPIKTDVAGDTFTLYKLTKADFDYYIIDKLESRVLRQMLVKYYTKVSDYAHINSNTLKLIQTVTNISITELPVLSYIKYDCIYFGSRDKIDEYYFIKTQGKQKNKITYNNPYDISITDEPNEKQFTPEQVANSKVLLNGLYGIPALRPYFNIFRLHDETYINHENGYKNNERNIIFSIFVTSVALYNLLYPLKFLTEKEIDECFTYCDTDSLYLEKSIFHKIPKSLFNPYHLGAWDIENETIDKMIILNHKKYAYTVNGQIKVKAAGIPTNTLDTNMSFSDFHKSQFKNGITIKTTKSILNAQGTISIYPSTTKLQQAFNYPIYLDDERSSNMLNNIIEEVKQSEELEHEEHQLLYIETPYGVLSHRDIYHVPEPIENTRDISDLKNTHDYLKTVLT